MSFIRRNSSLTLAILLTLALAAAKLRSRAVLVEPPAPAVADFKVETKGSLILVAKLFKPAAQRADRGARLREKGEALGGGTPDRVEASSRTLTAQ